MVLAIYWLHLFSANSWKASSFFCFLFLSFWNSFWLCILAHKRFRKDLMKRFLFLNKSAQQLHWHPPGSCSMLSVFLPKSKQFHVPNTIQVSHTVMASHWPPIWLTKALDTSHPPSLLTWKSWTLAGGSFWKSKVALAKVGSSRPHVCEGNIA